MVNDGSDRMVIHAGDVPKGKTETIKCGSGEDTVKFFGFSQRDRDPANRRRFTDPDTGGTYLIDADCENLKSNDDLAYLDPELMPGTTCAAPGTSVGITGSNFPPNATIAVSLGERRISEFQTNASGDFAGPLTVPDLQPNTYPLTFIHAESEFNERLFFTVAAPTTAQAGIQGSRWILVLGGAIVLASLFIALAIARRRKLPA